ncbi:MAG: FKBP-type peptidyl-prolyl cis-trans isomerase [Chloroflexota bacterium]|nr:FKBP-type peptidyl-prolyl cis-trans isomerase [Chloroflexota bacterium]
MVASIHHQTIEGLRVHLSPLRVLSAAVIPLLFLTACAHEKAAPSALDGITVGGTDKAPTLTFSTKPLTVTATTTKVVTAGKGAKTTKTDAVKFNYVMVNGKDGKQKDTNFDKTPMSWDLSNPQIKGLSAGLTDQLVGSRLLIAMPPADAFGAQGNPQMGFGATDNVIFLIDLISAVTPAPPLKTATGDPVTPPAGLPTVKVDAKGVPVVTVPKTPPPTKAVVQVLIKGKGPAVKADQQVTVAYTGVIYGTGKIFDSSYTSGQPLKLAVTDFVPGFTKGMVGQTVGSRVLLILPPADGYGAEGSPGAGIKGTDTIVFVVDILAAN